jgi:phosphoribosylamine--glycine ligase
MRKYGIPTAAYETFDDAGAAEAHLRTIDYPAYIKADGLALGKGAVLVEGPEEACAVARGMLSGESFGASGRHIVVEERMTGPEVTVLAFADGKTVVPMVSSQDHKRALDGDWGLNTGGMGAIAPSPHYGAAMAERCMREIFRPTLEALRAEGAEFRGVIYFQLMLTASGPKVIEYNARFGDPEAQAVLPLLKSDLLEIFEAVVDGRLDGTRIEWETGASACVVMASGGYPQEYRTGFPIDGVEAAEKSGAIVFHAGTRREPDGRLVTAGGRVLGVTATGPDLPAALAGSYAAVGAIHFENAHYRTDIGKA